MTPERWAAVKSVFQDALGVEASARRQLLDSACGDDLDMRHEVESLLDAYDGAGSFMGETQATRVMRCSRCDSLFTFAHVVCPSDGEVLAEDPSALVDVTLDELYHVEAIVGRGGFGTVYRARHELLRDVVAVKVLRREYAANPSLVRRFLREGRVARAIHHPNIVTIHDMRTSADGLVYMVLEYVDGTTLREEMRLDSPLGKERSLEILRQMALALDAAHEAGIVHRDLKPENVMLSRSADGERVVKVLDLGLAKLRELGGAVDPLTDLTLPGEQMGSPHYMSPEQWGDVPTDGSREIDARSDVYALAVMAFEMIVGRRPFTGDTVWDVRRSHLEAPRPMDAGAAVARALARDRAKRPASAGAFVAALENDRVMAPRPSRRSIAVAACVVAAALLGSGGWYAIRSSTSDIGPTPASVAVPPKLYSAMTDGERAAFVDDRARAISRMLSGREYHFPPDARVAIRRQVEQYASRVGTGDKRFGHEDLLFVLDRARAAAPTIAPPFAREGVPVVVALYLPFIESEYHSDERSTAGSRGMFQLMPSTAALYGAKPEELDSPAVSADVAARHFRDCMNEFASDRMGNALALAAYNLGRRDIVTYLEQVQALDDEEAESRFWSLAGNSGFKNFKNAESPRYITAFFAAAVVGENPEAFGISGSQLSKGL